MARRIADQFAAVAMIAALSAGRSDAQAPTLPDILPPSTPGSTRSTLGPPPGSSGLNLNDRVGGPILGGRPGSTTPRVPASISNPGATTDPTGAAAMPAIPRVAPLTQVPLYGTLELPLREDDGPADGLTFDQALDLMLRVNLDLIARRFEIPSAQADVLTASLRANPILYADSQLVPYGEFTPKRPGGQTQYDLNITQPIDYSGKRKYRTIAAVAAKRTVEAQYQDAVRLQIANLADAYVGVLAARETVRYVEAGLKGFDGILAASRELGLRGDRTSADVGRIEAQRDSAAVGLLDAREQLRRSKRALGLYLNMTPAQADAIEINASLRDDAPMPPLGGPLADQALKCRPDVVAYRLGLSYANAGLRLQEANRYSDAYLLAQPYTFQNNSPDHLKSAYSYAVGITVPLPVNNRNQGNIERARLNIGQTKAQLEAVERLAVSEVARAEEEYASTRDYLDRLARSAVPKSKKAFDDTRALFDAGELKDVTLLLNVQREYNDIVRQYRDIAVRHRRSMFGLNTAVGSRVLP